MLPKNSGGSSKFPGGQQVIHRIAQTAFVRVVTPRNLMLKDFLKEKAFATCGLSGSFSDHANHMETSWQKV